MGRVEGRVEGRFEGRVAIVTGSSSGIGEAVARQLAAEGARVVVNSVSSVETGTALADALPEALYVQGDVSQEADCRGLVDAAVDRWGQLDLVVNNAGWTKVIDHADLESATDEVWRRILDTNVMGSWYLTRAAAPALREAEDGNVVNVSSVAGVRPTGSSIPYAVSKAALNHLTRLLAKALGPDVRVNAVAPGLIETPWTQTEEWESIHAYVSERVPMRRSGTPEDVATACLGLAEARWTTGEIVVVDGGMQLLV